MLHCCQRSPSLLLPFRSAPRSGRFASMSTPINSGGATRSRHCSLPDGATRTRHDDAIPGRRLLLHAWMTSICRAAHWSCCNLVLHPPGNTNNLVDVLYQCGSRCLLQAPSPPWHCCRSACKVHVSHLHVPCVWRRIEVRCYPLLPRPATTLLLPTRLNRARLSFTTGISTTSFSPIWIS